MSTLPRRSPFPQTEASVLLDATRGIASLLVCLSHWRALFFIDFQDLHPAQKTLYALPYLLSGAGHQAVVIFFVLSGYLVGGSVFRLLLRGEWSWRRYLTHRLIRLWIVLVPALALGAAFDFGGIRSGLAPLLYAGRAQNHVIGNVASTLGFSAFAGNLFFTQTILVPTFGSNGPLWSLANEFWYYILFPCGLLSLKRGQPRKTRALSAALFVGFAAFAGRDILLLFPVWLLGAALAGIRVPVIGQALCAVIRILFVPVFFILSKAHGIPETISDYLLALATFVFFISLLNAFSEAPDSLWTRVSRMSARFSYTLYLIHVPLLTLLSALTLHGSRWSPGMSTVSLALLELFACICVAWSIASITEFRTDEVRRKIESLLDIRSPPLFLGSGDC